MPTAEAEGTGKSGRCGKGLISACCHRRNARVPKPSLVGAPHAGQMTRQAQPRHEHDVESDRQLGQLRAAHQEGGSGTDDAAALARQNRLRSGVHVAARLDLDDRQNTTAPRQNVDLTRYPLSPAGLCGIQLLTY